jgi:hypothetical protein
MVTTPLEKPFKLVYIAGTAEGSARKGILI